MKSETRSRIKITPVKCTFANIPLAIPKKQYDPDERRPIRTMGLHTIENTGLGDDICVDAFFGRIFLSDAGVVHDTNEAFSEEYDRLCEAVDENSSEYIGDVLNYNDLYKRHHLADDYVAGENWGWPTATDWRMNPIEWDEEWVDSGPYAEKFGRAIFMFKPKDHCAPIECYREVC